MVCSPGIRNIRPIIIVYNKILYLPHTFDQRLFPPFSFQNTIFNPSTITGIQWLKHCIIISVLGRKRLVQGGSNLFRPRWVRGGKGTRNQDSWLVLLPLKISWLMKRREEVTPEISKCFHSSHSSPYLQYFHLIAEPGEFLLPPRCMRRVLGPLGISILFFFKVLRA